MTSFLDYKFKDFLWLYGPQKRKIAKWQKKTLNPFVSFRKSTTFASQFRKRGSHSWVAERKLGYGVIGNTTDSGPVIHGSSPCIPTQLRLRIFIWSLNCFLFLMHDFPWIQTYVQCLFGYSPKVDPRGPPHRTRGVRHRGPLGYGMFAVCKFLLFLFVVGVSAASFCLPGFPCLRCYVFLRKSCLVDEKTLFLQHISDLVPNGCISLLFRT